MTLLLFESPSVSQVKTMRINNISIRVHNTQNLSRRFSFDTWISFEEWGLLNNKIWPFQHEDGEYPHFSKISLKVAVTLSWKIVEFATVPLPYPAGQEHLALIACIFIMVIRIKSTLFQVFELISRTLIVGNKGRKLTS